MMIEIFKDVYSLKRSESTIREHELALSLIIPTRNADRRENANSVKANPVTSS